MITHEQTRELINEIKTLISLSENHSLGYSALEHARKLVFHVETELAKPTTEEEIKEDLREIKDWFGGWPELRKEIESMEDNDNEAAWERSQNRDYPSAGEQAEMMHRIQRDLK